LVPVSSLFPVPDSSPQTTREHVSPLIFTSPEARRKRIRSGRRREKKHRSRRSRRRRRRKSGSKHIVRGLRRNKSKKEERKEKTLQSAARVEKEIPVRARHWRETSAMDIRKGERRR
jgi:hypothetical protein